MDWDELQALLEAGRQDPAVVEQRVSTMDELDLVDFHWHCKAQEAYALADLAGRAHAARFPKEPYREEPPENELLWADFWALIESGREDPNVVVERIHAMTEQELVNLWWRFQDAVDLLSTADDEDEVVASWVVQQGKACYDRCLADPAKLPSEVPVWHGPSYRGEVVEVYDDRYGEPIRDQDYEPGGYLELERDAFWDLIDSGLEDPMVVERALAAMSEAELVDFRDRYEQAVAELTDEPYSKNAGYDGVHSEDHHLDIAEWIVSRGRRFYALHLGDPKLYPLEPGDDAPGYNHLAANLYHRRYGEVIRAPEDPPPASGAPDPPRRKGLLARLFGHGDP